MTTPPLACGSSEERMPDREWVRSDHRAENPGIQKEEDQLRLDSWIQTRSTGRDQISVVVQSSWFEYFQDSVEEAERLREEVEA